MIMEALFAILFLVTGILLARLHTSYCVKKLMMFDEECNSVEISFVAVPVIFFLCTAGWVRYLLSYIVPLRMACTVCASV